MPRLIKSFFRKNRLARLGQIGLMTLLFGCQPQPRLVVFADPCLEEVARALLTQPETGFKVDEISLKIISSEVIAKYVAYGEPMDLFFSTDPAILVECGVPQAKRKKAGEALKLAATHLVWVEAPKVNQARFNSENCWLRAASDTPLRNYTDDWFASRSELPQPDCWITADFYKQMRDYLVRGWVSNGIIYESEALSVSSLKQIAKGPRIEGVVSIFWFNEGPNSTEGKRLWDELQSDKSKSILGGYGFIP